MLPCFLQPVAACGGVWRRVVACGGLYLVSHDQPLARTSTQLEVAGDAPSSADVTFQR